MFPSNMSAMRRAITVGLVAVVVAVVGVVALVTTAFTGGPAASIGTSQPLDKTALREGEAVTWDSELAFHACCDGSVLPSDFSRNGGTSFRSHLEYGDAEVADGTRAEVHTGHWDSSQFRSGRTVYYGFSIYIVSSWETDSRQEILFQWHTQPDECEDMKYPSAFLSLEPDGQWRLRVNSDDDRCGGRESMTRERFDLTRAEPGSWHDFVFEFDWDYTEAGSVEVWHQTDKRPGWESVLQTSGPNTYNDDQGVTGYLKWGVYKPAWNDGPTDVDQRTVFHDNIAFGNSFESVDPSLPR